jgi:SAM-dependent methyltransferase
VAKKQKAKKTSKRRGGKDTGHIAETIVSSPQGLCLSPADGVRDLRRLIEARSASGPKRERAALARALSGLEAEYERVSKMTGSVSVLDWSAPASRQAKRSAKRVNEGSSGTSMSDGKTQREELTFVPTPAELVDVMLKLAKITPKDIVYDLGCGDGRIVIAAAKQYHARGVGIDIDPQRIEEASGCAAREGVADRVRFLQADLFEADIRDATVVMLYLLSSLNLELRPRLLDQLAVGTRVVSHAFDMGDWPPAQTLETDGRRVYLWIIPDRSTRRAEC